MRCRRSRISGADGSAIGFGAANTSDILAGCDEAGIAAEICEDYSGGGYNDWFLPSKDELNEMSRKKATIDATAAANGGSGFASALYWSSTEAGNNFGGNINAWQQSFDFAEAYQGYQNRRNKNIAFKVRAVRAF